MDVSWSAVVKLARSNAERVAVWSLVVLIVAGVGLGWYVTNPLSGSDASLATVRADENVSLSYHDGTYRSSQPMPNRKLDSYFIPVPMSLQTRISTNDPKNKISSSDRV